MNAEKIYSAADFARYYNGAMTPAEMQSLEKAALADPFLADALEGYAHAPSAEKDAAFLRENISGRAAQQRTFLLLRLNKTFLRVAAMLVFFAGAAYIFYRTSRATMPAGLAKTEIKTPLTTDTAEKNSTDTATVTFVAPASGNMSVQPSAQAELRSKIAVSGAAAPGNISTETAKESADSIRSFYRDEPAPKATQPEAVSTIQNEKKYDADITADKISVNAKDREMINEKPAEPIALGVKRRKIAGSLPSAVNANNNYHAQNDFFNTNTVNPPLSGEEKKIMLDDRASGKIAAKTPVVALPPLLQGTVAPADSAAFNNFLDDSLREIKKPDGEAYAGKVMLSFNVTPQGKAVNIKVEKPLCNVCDDQAVELLKKSPPWIYVPGKRRRVAVEY